MKIVAQGVIFRGTPDSRTANCCFPSICRFEDGGLLASWRIGSAKDSADGTILLSRSTDGGQTWESPYEPFSATITGRAGTFALGGCPGSLHYAPLAALGPQQVLAGVMWLDRSHPTRPMFNPKTEGLVTVQTLFSESTDGGKTWSPCWAFDSDPYPGLAGICGPVLSMPDGRLGCPFEVNKPYDDPNPWRQVAGLKFSGDGGRTWYGNVVVAQDPSLRVRYWDQRHALAPDGTCVAMLWTYDSLTHKELNFHITQSNDGGKTWTPPRDSGIPYQLPYPIFLPDGRLLVFYIDRYDTRTIRARFSLDKGKTFQGEDYVIHQQPGGRTDPGRDEKNEHHLDEQQMWTFGRLEGVADPSGDVWVVHYAGDPNATSIYWARLRG